MATFIHFVLDQRGRKMDSVQPPMPSHSRGISVTSTLDRDEDQQPAGRRQVRKFGGGKNAGVELDPQPSDSPEDPLVCLPNPLRPSWLLTMILELAAVEKGACFWLPTSGNRCGRRLKDNAGYSYQRSRGGTREQLYGNNGPNRATIDSRGICRAKECRAVAYDRQEIVISHQLSDDVTVGSMDYACFRELHAIHDFESPARVCLGHFRVAGFALSKGYVLCKSYSREMILPC